MGVIAAAPPMCGSARTAGSMVPVPPGRCCCRACAASKRDRLVGATSEWSYARLLSWTARGTCALFDDVATTSPPLVAARDGPASRGPTSPSGAASIRSMIDSARRVSPAQDRPLSRIDRQPPTIPIAAAAARRAPPAAARPMTIAAVSAPKHERLARIVPRCAAWASPWTSLMLWVTQASQTCSVASMVRPSGMPDDGARRPHPRATSPAVCERRPDAPAPIRGRRGSHRGRHGAGCGPSRRRRGGRSPAAPGAGPSGRPR